MSSALRNITIVGGGTSGWLAASMIFAGRNRRNDGEDIAVTLIESPGIPTVGVGEATTLSMMWTLGLLALDEKDFFRHCDASVKAGVRFDGWDTGPDGAPSSYYHPFEAPHYVYGYAPAYHYHKRARAGVAQPPFAESMVTLPALMRAGKAPRRMDSPDFEGLAPYSYHVDATLFAGYLKEFCTTLDVTHIVDDVVDVELDERGFVTGLRLAEGGLHPVEFVVDCSGFRGLVIRKTLDEPYITYQDSLLCDRALALQLPHRDGAPLDAFTTSTALGAGWSWHVPLFSRRGTGYVFSSRFRSDEEAIAEFRDYLGPEAGDAEPAVIAMPVGRSRRSWVNNCLAVGLASGFVEPLESTSIHFVQMSIRWLLDNFPDRDCAPPLRDNYNRLVQSLYEDIRDFIVMHYCTSNREDTDFWRTARHDIAVPDRLRENLELWKHKLPSAPDLPNRTSLFSEWNYIYVLYGKHYYDGVRLPTEDVVGDDDFDEFSRDLDRRRSDALGAAADHWELLKRLRQTPTEPWYRAEGDRTLETGAPAIV